MRKIPPSGEGIFESDPLRILQAMLGYGEARVIEAQETRNGLRISLETPLDEAVCPRCGHQAELDGISMVERVEPKPFFEATICIWWNARRWRCGDPQCPNESWVEEIPKRLYGD